MYVHMHMCVKNLVNPFDFDERTLKRNKMNLFDDVIGLRQF